MAHSNSALSTRFFLGIDGGGSTTRALIGTEDGQLWGYGEAGGSNPHVRGIPEAIRELKSATERAWADSGLSPRSFAGAFLGIAGAGTLGAEQRTQLAAWLPRTHDASVEVDHDIRIALAGGLSGSPGIAIIAGTGSSGYARTREGSASQAGGWGPLIDDIGGGYWLGLKALGEVARAYDRRGPATTLTVSLLQAVGCTHERQILEWLAKPEIGRAEIAELAPCVFDCARSGDAVAVNLMETGAHELALIATALETRWFSGHSTDVVFTGGLARCIDYREAFSKALRATSPSLRVHSPDHPPIGGAYILALAGGNIAACKHRLNELSTFLPTRTARQG